MKRIIFRICVLCAATALVLSLAFMCSCEKKQVFPNEPITLPLEKTYTLSYWLNFDNAYMPDYSSFNDHPYFKWLEEKTNIHIDFEVPTSTASSVSELIGMLRGEWITRIASGSMTDMVEHYYFVPDIDGGIDNAEDEELYYVLNEYIDVQMDNFNALREEYSVIDKLLITPYGNIMYIPKITGIEDDNKGTPITQGLVIRKDFLDELQLAVPETIEEWENVLDAFQVSLGVTDPLMMGTFPLDAVLEGDPFLSAYDVSYKFFINKKSGKLDYGCISEGMREYVALLSGWRAKGIMNCSSSVTEEIKLSDSVGAFYATMNELVYLNSVASNPSYELVACPYPVLNKGDTIDLYDTYMPIGNREVNSTYITCDCDSPALAVKWLDQQFSEESFMRASYGKEGEDYTVDEAGNITLTDKLLNDPDGAISGIYKNCLLTSYYNDRDVLVKYAYTQEQKSAITTWSNVTRDRSVIRTTSMNMTQDDEELSKTFGNFFMIQFNLKSFITGGKDLTEWDSYVAQMNDAGMQEYIEISQNAWDRYLAN